MNEQLKSMFFKVIDKIPFTKKHIGSKNTNMLNVYYQCPYCM
ncbi:hypothetical protein HPSMNH_0533 [Glaesserella parasuis MN-H]|nr:hypothetical protein HPSMNH_0533 [Glaesserella parasuis MN-H]EQA06877.1 hypothetical protein HPSH465_1389 [Glaesserella parasuis H465]